MNDCPGGDDERQDCSTANPWGTTPADYTFSSTDNPEVTCGSDSFSCPINVGGGFQLTSGQSCIPQSWVCDGEGDCPGNTDELNCVGSTTSNPSTPDPDEGTTGSGCPFGRFQCGDGQCISRYWKCDG